MSRHPAPDELLLDFVTGVLPEGPALAVALKVALDPEARRTVDRLRALGGALLESEEAAASGDDGLERVLARLDAVPVEPEPARPEPRAGFEWAPAPLLPYLAGKSWQRTAGDFEHIEIDLHGDTHRVALLKLDPGKGLPNHKHTASEYTVVLQGGFTDNTGSYAAGDFAIGPGPQAHEPIADPGEPCIALIVGEKRVVFTGMMGRLINLLVLFGMKVVNLAAR